MFEDLAETKFSLDELMSIRDPATYLVRADGDSMVGVGIFNKDVMVVDKGRDAELGNVIIAVIDNDVMVKIYDRDHEQIMLRSANPKYPPRYVLENEEFYVWGVVVNSVRAHTKYTATDNCLPSDNPQLLLPIQK